MNTFNVVGMHFAFAKDILKSLPSDTTLGLVREPTNPYDPNAIQVWFDAETDPVLQGSNIMEHAQFDVGEPYTQGSLRRIGYVPKEVAADLARAMDDLGLSTLLARLVYAGETLGEIDCYYAEGPDGMVVKRTEEEVKDETSADPIRFDYEEWANATE